jgi:hypothetical protein
MLYDDHDRAAAQASRPSPVATAPRSPAARDKDIRGITADGLPVHSFHSLLADLATFTRNEVTTAAALARLAGRTPDCLPQPALAAERARKREEGACVSEAC